MANVDALLDGGCAETSSGNQMLRSILFPVREGQTVSPETRLGIVGTTGGTNGKHLHFEISLGGHSLDPQRVIEAARHVQQTKE